jgi:anti-sigma factor RsiW
MSFCPPFQDLSALIDAALSSGRELAVRRHLDGCAACRQWVSRVHALRQAVGRAYGSEMPSPALRRAVTALGRKRRRDVSSPLA